MHLDRSIEIAVALRMTCCNRTLVDRASSELVTVIFDTSDAALEFSRGRSCLGEVARTYGLSPLLDFSASTSTDDIINAVKPTIEGSAVLPRLVVVENLGVFAIGYTKTDAETVLDCLLQKKMYQESGEQHLLPGRLDKCVTIVTGSAQGFGKGIAQELAREGAYVVVTDLNDEAGAVFADELNAEYGAGTAIYCHCDVIKAESIAALVTTVVHTYGGVDMFISNAGVLKAGSLDEMDEKGFDLVTSVNYKAFFLCTQAASRIMRLQHQYNASHVMDIIQVNSKSGLEGSNKNFAYSGSKFGGIGLTQSFALELVEHNIKVNAVCPGNYYEGPLWSDPQTGLFVQYLATGKVPGARTVDDVKDFYLSKVPMRKGCSPLDVARAILYCREQTNETGQAIPVTGGQVMLG
jgi:NAD(P)-dependent dehydrogenase (short-subunit alcohol dehydrogenase family)